MDRDIWFTYEGVHYTVSMRAYDLNKIVLPDGRVLESRGWLESLPPQPSGLHEVPCLFSSLSPDETARLMNGVVAKTRN